MTDEVASEEAVRSAVVPREELRVTLNVCERTLYRLLNRGEIPGGIRVGRHFKVLREPFERSLATGEGWKPSSVSSN